MERKYAIVAVCLVTAGFAFPLGEASADDCLAPLQEILNGAQSEGTCLGELYCDDTVGCGGGGLLLDNDAQKCGWGSWWNVDGETVSGKGNAYPYLACSQTGGHDNSLVDCEIDTQSGKVACHSGGDWGSENPLDCDVFFEVVLEDMTVKFRCKDPPMPGKAGIVIEKTKFFDVETGVATLLEASYTVLEPLQPEP